MQLRNFNDIFGFLNTINSGTRINPINGYYALLDVILCLNILSFMASTVITYPDSDHRLIISIFNLRSIRNNSNIIQSRCLNIKKLDEIKLKLKTYFNFLDFCNISNSNDLWLIIKSVILYFIDEVAPVKSFNTRSITNSPWFDH